MRFLGMAAACWLVATAATGAHAQEVGSGELWIDQSVMTFYEKFQREVGGSYFAVSTNGHSAGYSYCKAFHCDQKSNKRIAVKACVDAGGNQGGLCYIFGNTSRVLWQGTVHVVTQ